MILKELQQYNVAPDCFFINKPAGWSIHNDQPSLVEYLKKSNPHVHFVNRIDQETSGLVLWTSRAELVDELQKVLSSIECQKVYRVISPKPRQLPGPTWVWNQPISPGPEGRKNPFGVKNQRVRAVTEVEVLGENKWFLDMKAAIKTGRQHQIRKHFAGHSIPIVGDGRYGRPALNEKIKDTYGEERLFLHSWQVKGQYKQQEFTVEALLPEAFAKLMIEP